MFVRTLRLLRMQHCVLRILVAIEKAEHVFPADTAEVTPVIHLYRMDMHCSAFDPSSYLTNLDSTIRPTISTH